MNTKKKDKEKTSQELLTELKNMRKKLKLALVRVKLWRKAHDGLADKIKEAEKWASRSGIGRG